MVIMVSPLRLKLYIFLASLAPLVSGIPLFIVTSGKPRCVTATAPHGTTLHIDFEAPDLILDRRDPHYGPAWITIQSKVTKPTSASEWNQHMKNRFSKINVKPQSQELKEKEGTISFETEINGQVSICIRAATASTSNPMRFGLLIEKEDNILRQSKGEDDAKEDHLSHMELEMKHLMASMRDILSEADFSKERESRFHQQTLHMHAASIWWPIVQLCVLLLTGFTQANHVVRFLRSKHLI